MNWPMNEKMNRHRDVYKDYRIYQRRRRRRAGWLFGTFISRDEFVNVGNSRWWFEEQGALEETPRRAGASRRIDDMSKLDMTLVEEN